MLDLLRLRDPSIHINLLIFARAYSIIQNDIAPLQHTVIAVIEHMAFFHDIHMEICHYPWAELLADFDAKININSGYFYQAYFAFYFRR